MKTANREVHGGRQAPLVHNDCIRKKSRRISSRKDFIQLLIIAQYSMLTLTDDVIAAAHHDAGAFVATFWGNNRHIRTETQYQYHSIHVCCDMYIILFPLLYMPSPFATVFYCRLLFL